jgi:hypothetical protein
VGLMSTGNRHLLGPDFEWRLGLALGRIKPPTPQPSSARYRIGLSRSHRRPALLAVALAATFVMLAGAAGATAATGSANPSIWTERAVNTFQTVSHLPAAPPTPAAEPSPAVQVAPVESSSPPPARTDIKQAPKTQPSPEGVNTQDSEANPHRDGPPPTGDPPKDSPPPSPDPNRSGHGWGGDQGGHFGGWSPSDFGRPGRF